MPLGGGRDWRGFAGAVIAGPSLATPRYTDQQRADYLALRNAEDLAALGVGLSMVQTWVLRVAVVAELRRFPRPITQGDITKATGVGDVAVARAVAALADEDMVLRGRDERHRRTVTASPLVMAYVRNSETVAKRIDDLLLTGDLIRARDVEGMLPPLEPADAACTA